MGWVALSSLSVDLVRILLVMMSIASASGTFLNSKITSMLKTLDFYEVEQSDFMHKMNCSVDLIK